MRRAFKIIGIAACVAVVCLAVAIYALLHGYFEKGVFEIKQEQWSSSGQVAIVVKRYDHVAFGNVMYFVLIGDHLFSPTEIKHAYHSDAVVFAAAFP